MAATTCPIKVPCGSSVTVVAAVCPGRTTNSCCCGTDLKPGTTIVWRNQDRVQHHVTGGEFDSGRIHGGSQWAQVIGRPGLYQFLCSFHPTMRAEITVSTDDTRPLHLGS